MVVFNSRKVLLNTIINPHYHSCVFMTDIYLTTSLSTHNGDNTPQNFDFIYSLFFIIRPGINKNYRVFKFWSDTDTFILSIQCMTQRQMKHQLDATLCRFYFCRVTLHVSGASAHHHEYLKLVQQPLVHVLSLQVSHHISLLGPFRP